MRRKARTDDNQQTLVDVFRKLGATVDDLSAVGKGMTDLLVNKYGLTYKVEVKDGSKIPSQQKLTPSQVKHHAQCRGAICVVKDEEECIELINKMRRYSQHIAEGEARL